MTSNSNSNARDSIAVFGGTGPSGELVVREALSRGYDVVMYARSPGKIPEDLKENSRVRIVEGTLEQGGKIAEAVRGTSVVHCHEQLAGISASERPSVFITLTWTHTHTQRTGTVAVISCLGPLPSTPSPFRAKSTPIADGTRTILKAMKEEGVKVGGLQLCLPYRMTGRKGQEQAVLKHVRVLFIPPPARPTHARHERRNL